MAKTVLTDITVQRTRPPSVGQIELVDEKLPGFRLRISQGGTRTFVLVFMMNGVRRRVTLGRYPSTSLGMARSKALEMLYRVSEGDDPKPPPRRDEGRQKFESVVEKFLELHCQRHNRLVTQRDTERILRRRFVSVWGDRDVTTIGKRDVIDVLDSIIAEGTPSAANHALSAIRKCFNWSVERSIITASPCAGIEKPSRETSRDRVLDDQELISIWRAADRVGFPFGAIVQVLMTTAQRRSEVAQMRWSQIDRAAKNWSLPAELTKSNRAHLVPLSSLTMTVLKTLPRNDGADLIFPGRLGGDRPFSDFSSGKRLVDSIAQVRDWTLHDLRRSAATGMAQLGTQPHVIERLLNHMTGTLGGVAGIYNRFGYQPEMRDALQLWSNHLSRLVATKGDEP